MENKKLKWCFKIREGIRFSEPNKRISNSYIEQAKASLLRAEKNFKDNDLLWTTITIYYAEYYALYSFLQRIGVKSENHLCSITVSKFLLGEEKIKLIEDHKEKRIDAQYYIKVDQKNKIQIMLNEAKDFVSYFDELISNLTEKEIKNYLGKIMKEIEE